MFEGEPLYLLPLAGMRACNADETHDRAVSACLREQCGELLLRAELNLFKASDDALPPDTGGRNSTVSSGPMR
jgi:hypothetical protein